MKRTIVLTSLAAVLLQSTAGSLITQPLPRNRGLRFQRIVAFGDSLSDNASHGVWVISNHTWPADPAYYKGRFSNGPTWIENVARSLDMPLLDYAVGGATSNNTLVQGYNGPNSTIPVPAMADQVSQYLNSKHDAASSTLFSLFIGTNDPFFLQTLKAEQVVQNVEQAITQLRNAGARSFILVTPASLDLIPYDKDASLPKEAITALGLYSADLRNQLSSLSTKLDSTSSHVRVAFVDLVELTTSIVKQPSKYGFDPKTINEPCLKGIYFPAPGGRSLCPHPNRFLWWDEFHPTEAGHKLIAKIAKQAIDKRFK